MALTVTTDHATIGELLDAALAADPVRGTVLGTIRTTLGDFAWCAHSADRAALAVRSERIHPVVLGGSWPEEPLPELAGLLAALPDLAGVSSAVATVQSLAPALPAPSTRMSERLFRLDALRKPAGVDGRGRRALAPDRDLVLACYEEFVDEAGVGGSDPARQVDDAIGCGGCWLWLDVAEQPVALATRRPVIAGSARIGPVYTPPEHRGHGYGSAVTAAATADILRDGAIPVLFTDLRNPVSNAIYPRLGYYPVEDRLIIRFS